MKIDILWDDFSCKTTYGCYVAFELVIICVCAVFSAIRVRAVIGKNWFLILLALAFGLVPVGTNLFRFSHASVDYSASVPYVICEGDFKLSSRLENRVIIATRSCSIACDCIVIAVTWYSTYESARLRRVDYLEERPTLASLLLRDGSLYFLALLSLNLIDIFTYRLSNTAGNLTGFILPISSILISRLLLHIHEAACSNTVYLGSQLPSFVRSSQIDITSTTPGDAVFLSSNWMTAASEDVTVHVTSVNGSSSEKIEDDVGPEDAMAGVEDHNTICNVRHSAILTCTA